MSVEVLFVKDSSNLKWRLPRFTRTLLLSQPDSDTDSPTPVNNRGEGKHDDDDDKSNKAEKHQESSKEDVMASESGVAAQELKDFQEMKVKLRFIGVIGAYN